MTKLWRYGWLVAAFILVGATLAMAGTARMPLPGSLNSVQGRVMIDGQSALAMPVRGEVLRTGQEITTRRGKAELLLTPGSFLRIGNHSRVRMVSRSLEKATVRLARGTALLDANANFRNELTVVMDGTRTRIDKKGLYGFSVGRRTIAVLRGKASIAEGDSQFVLKRRHEAFIEGRSPLEIRHLNVRAFKSSSLYAWNRLRNRYEANARRSVRAEIARSGRWYGPGWYWSHFWGSYAYLPSAGAYLGPYYGGPYYGPWGWNGWNGGWGYGWGYGWDDDDD